MKKLWQENNGVLYVMAGSDITDTIAEAIALSAKKKFTIKFEFKGVTVSVRSDSNPELIYRDWSRSLSGYIGKSVGPNPNPVLTDKEKASDARIKAKNERAREKRQAEYKGESQDSPRHRRSQVGQRSRHRARR